MSSEYEFTGINPSSRSNISRHLALAYFLLCSNSCIMSLRLSSVCPDMFCPVNCAGRGKCLFGQTSGSNITRPRCECFDETDKSAGCSDTFVLDGKYLRDGKGLTDNLKTNFFEPLIAVFVDHPDTWTTASWAWAAALFVVFLLMILCICSSFWPEKKKKSKTTVQTRYAV